MDAIHSHHIDISWITHHQNTDNQQHTSSTPLPTNSDARPKPPPPSEPVSLASLPHMSRDLGSHTGKVPSSPQFQRRPSWFSNISSKFSSSSTPNISTQSIPASSASSPTSASLPPCAIEDSVDPKKTTLSNITRTPVKGAMLSAANKNNEGDNFYVPAPPKNPTGGSFLGVFRRLSSSGGILSTSKPTHAAAHGVVERRVLNVNHHRERCQIGDLSDTKLRRVAFSVDVEVAPMPRYLEHTNTGCGLRKRANTTDPSATNEESSSSTTSTSTPASSTTATSSKEILTPRSSDVDAKNTSVSSCVASTACAINDCLASTKRRDKKKKSEEERLARKEKKRRLAEANGIIPLEIYYDSSSSDENTTSDSKKCSHPYPALNPVRIYRRCCQLRETPILKRVTEQLSNPDNFHEEAGLVHTLDLSNLCLQLSDFATLGDYFAIVPIRDVILDNCGATDEALRCVLAGLLAAKFPPKHRHRQNKSFTGAAAVATTTKEFPLPPDKRSGKEKGEQEDNMVGLVERLSLKGNKFGQEGWKYLCLFLYKCRSIRTLDVSHVAFPQPSSPINHSTSSVTSDKTLVPVPSASSTTSSSTTRSRGLSLASSHTTLSTPPYLSSQHKEFTDIAYLFGHCIRERLAGSHLELLNLGNIRPTSAQMRTILQSLRDCGVRRLGLAHNNIDEATFTLVLELLRDNFCTCIDLGGTNLVNRIDELAQAIAVDGKLEALSLTDCNLQPASISRILPVLVQLENFRFLELSHNRALFNTAPSAITTFRKYLPKMKNLKRIHLSDVSMSPEQAIALAEVIPEVRGLSHVNLLENPELEKLADAQTVEAQEEAFALYASLLAATRVSGSIVCIDIDVPSDRSSEVVKALAKKIVAYCLRNLQYISLRGCNSSKGNASGVVPAIGSSPTAGVDEGPFVDVLSRIIGCGVPIGEEKDDDDDDHDDHDSESVHDSDYVIGGTGVVRALACCLKNKGEDIGASNSAIDAATVGGLTGDSSSEDGLSSGKAKDMSKHLLYSARKIRKLLYPALEKARAGSDYGAVQRLAFLDETLNGIINRFEDEFPETRIISPRPSFTTETPSMMTASVSPFPDTCVRPAVEDETEVDTLDGEDDVPMLVRPTLVRSNSAVSETSRHLNNEEGRAHRVGHKLRTGIATLQEPPLSLDESALHPTHLKMMSDMLEELHDEQLSREVEEKGLVVAFRDARGRIMEEFQRRDPDHWARFLESQQKARANARVAKENSGITKSKTATSSSSATATSATHSASISTSTPASNRPNPVASEKK